MYKGCDHQAKGAWEHNSEAVLNGCWMCAIAERVEGIPWPSAGVLHAPGWLTVQTEKPGYFMTRTAPWD